MLRLTTRILLPALLVVSGCAGTETGNGMKDKGHTAKVELRLTDAAGTASDTFVGTDSDGTELTVTDAWASIDRIDLRFADGVVCSDVYDANATVVGAGDGTATPICKDDEGVLRIEGPFWVNLVTGESDPSLAAVFIPDGAYIGGTVKLHPRAPAEPFGDVLGDATLAADGVFADGSAFHLGLRFTSVVDFEGSIDFGDTVSSVLMLLDVSRWFADLPLSACAAAGDLAVDADGAYVVTDGKGGCQLAEQAITEAIRASGTLGTDGD